MPEFLAGLDLGQAQDYTALAIAECVDVATGAMRPSRAPTVLDGRTGAALLLEEPVTVAGYNFVHLARFPLGTSYPAIVANVVDLLAREPLAGHTKLVVDATGVGPPVVDMLKRTPLAAAMWAVTITGGSTVNRQGKSYTVPKRDLVSVVKVLLQAERLKVAAKLTEADTLTRELQNFQVKITAAANDVYGAWREGTHDDLVLAVALATWFGEHGRPRRWVSL